MYLTYILILISLFSLWFKKHRKVGNILLLISLVLALISGIINTIGVLIVILSAILIYLTRQENKKIIAIPIFAITAIFLLLNYIHILPGFNNLCIIKNVHVSSDAIPFTLYLNYNSLILTCLILIVFSSEIKLLNKPNEILPTLKLGCLYGLLAILILLPISYICSFIRYDFKLTNYTLIFIFVNLIFTCIPEEIFWRGFIQTKIQNYTNPMLGVLITSLAFASIHIIFAGIFFAILAFIASIIYGLAYIKTKRIEVSIICHYLVNLGQFIFFTYPILTSAYPN